MVVPAWVWFAVAIVAAGAAAALLLADRARSASSSRDRRRWASLKSWEFVDADPVLPSRWRFGAVHQGGHGRALDLATGAVPGPDGRRLAHVFDHEQAGRVTGVVAAVRGVRALPVALELRLPSAPLPDDAGLDSLGQVGGRYAFVTNVLAARPLMTPALARAADAIGHDVPLLWAEDTWVLATADVDATPERVQALLQALVEVSVALEDAVDAAYEAERGADPAEPERWGPGPVIEHDDTPGGSGDEHDDTPGGSGDDPDGAPSGDDAPYDVERDAPTPEPKPSSTSSRLSGFSPWSGSKARPPSS